jgi:hypothetical protein
MSKKTLLEENTVRKFMKFANIGHLAENYLDEAGMYEEEEAEALPPEAGMEDDMDMEPEMDMDMEPEAEMPAEEGAMGMGEKEQMLADVVAAVADALGVEAAIEGAEAAPEGEEEAMDFAPAVADEEMPAAEEEEEVMEMAHPEGEMEEGAYMEEDEHMEEGMHGKKEEEEEVVEGVEVMDEDTIVQETVKRVTARLKAMKEAKKKEDLVESITSRIIDALKSKK